MSVPQPGGLRKHPADVHRNVRLIEEDFFRVILETEGV